MEKLIVGSVFSGDKSDKWLELQMYFLKKTTTNFKHVVFLNGPVDPAIFKESVIIGQNSEDKNKSTVGFEQSYNHSIGLTAIHNHFKTNPSENYLLLDSDCFPIMKGWLNILIRKMDQNYKPEIAAAIRAENLDVFPHPCVMYMTPSAVHSPWLKLGIGKQKTLLQTNIDDNCCDIPMNKCYPLMKSNVHSVHPVFATIYNHMFYHHACGSRDLMPRSVQQGYFDHYIDHGTNVRTKNRLFDDLVVSPDKFIDKLLGKRNIML